MRALCVRISWLGVGELQERLVSHGEQFVDVDVRREGVGVAGRLVVDDRVRLGLHVHLFGELFELRGRADDEVVLLVDVERVRLHWRS